MGSLLRARPLLPGPGQRARGRGRGARPADHVSHQPHGRRHHGQTGAEDGQHRTRPSLHAQDQQRVRPQQVQRHAEGERDESHADRDERGPAHPTPWTPGRNR